MGGFIVGSTVALVLLQTTLLLLDREQTSWTFTLMQKTNAPDMHTLDMQACLLHHQQQQSRGKTNHSTLTHLADDAHCFLWFHTSQQIEPVLAQWNQHLILLAICSVHCIVSLYAVQTLHANNALHASKTRQPSAYGVYALGLFL
jgi:hypothetical protein